jgi:hypothetical protein
MGCGAAVSAPGPSLPVACAKPAGAAAGRLLARSNGISLLYLPHAWQASWQMCLQPPLAAALPCPACVRAPPAACQLGPGTLQGVLNMWNAYITHVSLQQAGWMDASC